MATEPNVFGVHAPPTYRNQNPCQTSKAKGWKQRWVFYQNDCQHKRRRGMNGQVDRFVPLGHGPFEMPTPQDDGHECILDIKENVHKRVELVDVGFKRGDAVPLFVDRSETGLLDHVKIFSALGVDVCGLWRMEGRQCQFSFVVDLHAQSNHDFSLALAAAQPGRRENVVAQNVFRGRPKIGEIDRDPSDQVVIGDPVSSSVIIKDPNVQITAGMGHVENKSAVGPWEPPWGEAIVDNVGPPVHVFVDNGHKGIGFVAVKSPRIHVGKVVTP
mmetsp:Transcript_2040/g.4422  ORF Transcript_2040/g.4422 Transcript_2040/m.4422 type:complete len:272 (-) Transcript_2040:956-1771(-)